MLALPLVAGDAAHDQGSAVVTTLNLTINILTEPTRYLLAKAGSDDR
jgi:hypothetical protein